jgi:hypothetical protein
VVKAMPLITNIMGKSAKAAVVGEVALETGSSLSAFPKRSSRMCAAWGSGYVHEKRTNSWFVASNVSHEYFFLLL